MLEVLTDANQGEENELPEDGDEIAKGREASRMASPESRLDLGMGKAKYYDRKQQLELVLAAQELTKDVGFGTHAARSEDEEACVDGARNTDVWEDENLKRCAKIMPSSISELHHNGPNATKWQNALSRPSNMASLS
ncbi:unnamed protein product [Sphagnum balticum]